EKASPPYFAHDALIEVARAEVNEFRGTGARRLSAGTGASNLFERFCARSGRKKVGCEQERRRYFDRGGAAAARRAPVDRDRCRAAAADLVLCRSEDSPGGTDRGHPADFSDP